MKTVNTSLTKIFKLTILIAFSLSFLRADQDKYLQINRVVYDVGDEGNCKLQIEFEMEDVVGLSIITNKLEIDVKKSHIEPKKYNYLRPYLFKVDGGFIIDFYVIDNKSKNKIRYYFISEKYLKRIEVIYGDNGSVDYQEK